MQNGYAKLKQERKKRNLSCKEMGRLLHISASYYSQIENNKRRLFYNLAVSIAKIFDLKPDDLFYD